MSHLRKYALVIGLTFALAFAAQYLASVGNVFATDWSTIQLCINSGIAAVFAWFVAYAGSLKTELQEMKLEHEAFRRAWLRDVPTAPPPSDPPADGK